MDNETNEEYTTKDFGVDVAKSAGIAAAETVAAYAALLAIGYTYVKVQEFRARRAAKKTAANEE